jgi:transketolase
VSIIEKIVHWFSPPKDTCAKGPTPEETAASRQEWRNEIHSSRQEVQRMQSAARQSKRTFDEVNENAYKVTDAARKSTNTLKVAENALKALEQRRNEN